MTYSAMVNYCLEKMFGNLSTASYVVVSHGVSFDIFGLPAKTEPHGLLLDKASHETEEMGTLTHYELQLDPGITAELVISRPPARIERQTCMVRGRILQSGRPTK